MLRVGLLQSLGEGELRALLGQSDIALLEKELEVFVRPVRVRSMLLVDCTKNALQHKAALINIVEQFDVATEADIFYVTSPKHVAALLFTLLALLAIDDV